MTTTPRPDAGRITGGPDGRLVVLCGRSGSCGSRAIGQLIARSGSSGVSDVPGIREAYSAVNPYRYWVTPGPVACGGPAERRFFSVHPAASDDTLVPSRFGYHAGLGVVRDAASTVAVAEVLTLDIPTGGRVVREHLDRDLR